MPEVPSNFSDFDAQAAGRALGSQPRTMRDIAHGDGEALDVGETTLEVYRDAGFARVTTPDARIELYRVPSYAINGERVVFVQGDQGDRTRLLIRGDGKVSFYPVLCAAETSQTVENPPGGRQDSPAVSDTLETATAADSRTPADEGDKSGEVELVRLRGRLGRDPWFSTRDDRPAAGFPLAVNPEDGGKAVWHNVVTFDDTAEELRQAYDKRQITKGRLVDVTGTPVMVEQPKSGGGVRRSREVHASVVSRVQSTRPQASR